MDQYDMSGSSENETTLRRKKFSLDEVYGEHFPQLLLDNLEAAIYTCDAEGYITMYNRAASALWGREPDIGIDLWCGSWKIYETDGVTQIALDTCPMAVTLKEGRAVVGHEIIIQKPDGERRFVVPYPRPFLDDQGRVTGAINLLMDVTPYKRIEKRAAQMAAIVDSSDDAIVGKTLDGIITSWNIAAERIFGYPAAEMVGQSLLKLIPKDRWEEEYHIQEQLRKGNKIDHYETKRLTKEGKLLDVSLTVSPIFDRAGRIIGASKIARDITREKRDRQALQESEEQYKMAVETAKLGTWALNPETNEMTCSLECLTILGITETAPMNLDRMLQLVFRQDSEMVRAELDRVIDPAIRSEYDIEHRIVRASDNNTRWIRVKGKMYFSASGKAEKMIGTMLDITDEKMAKEKLERTVKERTLELQKMNEQLRRSNHDLEQFAYIASHDLQEPLRKIQMLIEMIDQTDDTEVSESYFNKIRRSANRMAALIKDVLNYSRIDRNDTQHTTVNLNEILKDVLTDYENLIIEKKATIKSADMPLIEGIPSQIRQLFANLLGNSLKFSVASPVINITTDVPAERHIRLTFSDNGIGFDQQYAEKIFMIFQRLHSRSEYRGTGIGLALCKKIVENHRGHIEAKSEPGKGAIFTVILPL